MEFFVFWQAHESKDLNKYFDHVCLQIDDTFKLFTLYEENNYCNASCVGSCIYECSKN